MQNSLPHSNAEIKEMSYPQVSHTQTRHRQIYREKDKQTEANLSLGSYYLSSEIFFKCKLSSFIWM